MMFYDRTESHLGSPDPGPGAHTRPPSQMSREGHCLPSTAGAKGILRGKAGSEARWSDSGVIVATFLSFRFHLD